MHLFMSSPEWARYERTTVNSYRRRLGEAWHG